MSYKKILLSITGLILLFSFATPVLAINIWEGTSCAPDPSQGPTASCSLCDGLVVAQNIIMLLWELAIPISVAMIIWGALQMMFAAGNQSRFENGKKTITLAVTGLIIALAAWLIINEVLFLLVKKGLDLPWHQLQC